jgi:hypothetical protein
MALTLLLPAFARAQEFGKQGQAVFSAERLMGVSGVSSKTELEPLPDVEYDATEVSFGWRVSTSPFTVPRLGFDYLVIDHLSVGGSLGYASVAPDEGADRSAFLFAVRAGYAHSFSPVVAIWPRGGFTYHSQSIDDLFDESGFALTIECPFTFSPAAHFAFHVGPTFDIDFTGEFDPAVGSDVDRTQRAFGVNAGLTGWF